MKGMDRVMTIVAMLVLEVIDYSLGSPSLAAVGYKALLFHRYYFRQQQRHNISNIYTWTFWDGRIQ